MHMSRLYYNPPISIHALREEGDPLSTVSVKIC